MAIESNIPSSTRKLALEVFHMDLGGKEVIVKFKVEGDEERQTFRSDPEKWGATLKVLFNNLTDAAMLKDRVEDWLLANGHVTGTKVAD